MASARAGAAIAPRRAQGSVSCPPFHHHPGNNGRCGQAGSKPFPVDKELCLIVVAVLQVVGAPSRSHVAPKEREHRDTGGIHLLWGVQTPVLNPWIKPLIKTGGVDRQSQFKRERETILIS